MKRLIDISVSLFSIITFPFHFIFVKRPFRFFENCFAILFANKTWVGYAVQEKYLPALRKAVIACNGIPSTEKQALPLESLHAIDHWYARDYEPLYDLKLIARSYRQLGGQ